MPPAAESVWIVEAPFGPGAIVTLGLVPVVFGDGAITAPVAPGVAGARGLTAVWAEAAPANVSAAVTPRIIDRMPISIDKGAH